MEKFQPVFNARKGTQGIPDKIRGKPQVQEGHRRGQEVFFLVAPRKEEPGRDHFDPVPGGEQGIAGTVRPGKPAPGSARVEGPFPVYQGPARGLPKEARPPLIIGGNGGVFAVLAPVYEPFIRHVAFHGTVTVQMIRHDGGNHRAPGFQEGPASGAIRRGFQPVPEVPKLPA